MKDPAGGFEIRPYIFCVFALFAVKFFLLRALLELFRGDIHFLFGCGSAALRLW